MSASHAQLHPALRRALTSRLVETLAAPHGLGPYLEMLNPLWSLRETRAQVVGLEPVTPDTMELTLRVPADHRHLAGQFVRIGVEIAGRRQYRSYSITSSAERRDGHLTLGVKRVPDGRVSGHVHGRMQVGDVVSISPADGELTVDEALAADPTTPVLLVSGGSGITPVLSIVRTLVDRGHAGPVALLHYTPQLADVPYRAELEQLDRELPNVRVLLVPTGTPDQPVTETARHGLTGMLDGPHLAATRIDLDRAEVRACGPLGLTEAVARRWDAAGRSARLRVEAFEARKIVADVDAATGTITFTTSGTSFANDGSTLLDQAEAAGLSPAYGCRMGICGTCVLRKPSGPTRDARTGDVCTDSDVEVPICVTVPLGDVAING